jgi:DNA replication and repair protein RecF
MILGNFAFRNFRNFPDFNYSIGNRKILKIYGENGTGKTNILEAIFILFTTKSFRNRKTLKDCVRLGEPYFHLQADIDGNHHGITFLQDGNEKSFLINQNAVKSSEFFLGKSILYFSPEETTAFFQSQEARRALLDRYLSSLQDDFFHDLIQFTALKNRKVQILNSSTTRKESLLQLDRLQYLELSNTISQRREWFVQQLNPLFQNFVVRYNPKLDQTTLRYRRKNIPEDFLQRELQQQRVLYGSHKDELEITENGREVRHFFSNGEKKVINLAIHFSFMELLKSYKQKECLACLDDLESELDQRILGNILQDLENSPSQAIITSKNIEQSTDQDLLLTN